MALLLDSRGIDRVRWTDAALAERVAMANSIEVAARAASQTTDTDERQAALTALRHATALRRTLVDWMTRRTVDAQRLKSA
jgi:hypothetical protein